MQHQPTIRLLLLVASISLSIMTQFALDAAAVESECEQIGFWKKCGIFYTHSNGDQYKGDFSNRAPNGYGILTFGPSSQKSGDKYVGEMRAGVLHGNGTYYFANGDKYVGTWNGGQKNGAGTLFSNGQSYQQTYEFGRIISDEKTQRENAQKIIEKIENTAKAKVSDPIEIRQQASQLK